MEEDFFPVGAIAPLGGDIRNDDSWLYCDGREFDKEAYPELFTAIQHLYGGKDNRFMIPDYRGFFLRGADENHKLASIQEQSSTGRPNEPIYGSISNYPDPGNILDSHGITAGGFAGVPNENREVQVCTTGGDGDTRPINVYVNFYMKAKSE